jgi:hypothetical protein
MLNTALASHQEDGGIHQVAVSPVPVSQQTTALQSKGTERGRLDICRHKSNIIPESNCTLNPEAASFQVRDRNLLHHGKLYPDLVEDWDHVQQVQAGGVVSGVADGSD